MRYNDNTMNNTMTYDFLDGAGSVPAHQHSNGGGWVADSAYVAASAFVGPDAKVFGNAWIFDNAWVFDNVSVFDTASVSSNAVAGGPPLGSTNSTGE